MTVDCRINTRSLRWRWRTDRTNIRENLWWSCNSTVIIRIGTYFRIIDEAFSIDLFRQPADKKWIKFSACTSLRFSSSKTLDDENCWSVIASNLFCSYCLCTSNKWIILEFKSIVMLRERMWSSFRLQSNEKVFWSIRRRNDLTFCRCKNLRGGFGRASWRNSVAKSARDFARKCP